jgi:hypothetical protein
MAATILDAMSLSAGAFHTTFAPSAGTNRIAFRAITYGEGSNATPPPSAPTMGGQAMTLLATIDNDAATSDVCVSVYYLLEAGIAAMSGSALSTPGGSFTAGNNGDLIWSFAGAVQSAPAYNGAHSVATSGSLSLARVADSVTAAISVHDINNAFSSFANPSANGNTGIGNANTTAYGAATDTDRTASFTWANGFSRDNVSIVMNIAPAATGPTVNSITDPIIGTDAVTIVLSEAAPTVDTINFTVGTVTQSQSYSTGDNTTFTIAAVTRNLLPPIGTVTVELKAGAAVIATTTATLQQPAGYDAVTGAGVDDSLAAPHTGVLSNSDIAEVSDVGNTVLDTGFLNFAQTIPRPFTVRVWDASEELWGVSSFFTVDGGGGSTVIGSIINSVIIQSIIS